MKHYKSRGLHRIVQSLHTFHHQNKKLTCPFSFPFHPSGQTVREESDRHNVGARELGSVSLHCHPGGSSTFDLRPLLCGGDGSKKTQVNKEINNKYTAHLCLTKEMCGWSLGHVMQCRIFKWWTRMTS